MAASKYFLKWDSFKNNICNGLAQLQQRQEFVDMTLVAEGHFVKVHKNLISLASPYLKEMIKVAQCENPTIFFFNMSHNILCLILEYIYTGEVQIEIAKLDLFIKAATELQLPGISNETSSLTNTTKCNDVKNDGAETVTNETKILDNRLISYKNNNDKEEHTGYESDKNNDLHTDTEKSDAGIFGEFIKFCNSQKSDCNNKSSTGIVQKENYTDKEIQHEYSLEIDGDKFTQQQYTLSARGSLQLILNRYIYCMHHQAYGNRKRRWRCADYRVLRCPAYVDTLDDDITKRQNSHSHSYHDIKIMKKVKAKLIFGSLSTVIHKAKSLNKTKDDEIILESDSDL